VNRIGRDSVARGSHFFGVHLCYTNLPATSAATLRNPGATILHGPHHGAQKSTSTGRSIGLQRIERQIAWPLSTGSLGAVNSVLAFAATKCPLQRFVLETIALPTFGRSYEQSVIVCRITSTTKFSRLEVCPRVIWILSSAISKWYRGQ